MGCEEIPRSLLKLPIFLQFISLALMIARFVTWICVLYFRIAGWKIEGDIPPHKKYIIIVGPHTSALDVPIGIGARAIIGMDAKFLVKQEIFDSSWKYLFEQFGAVPVDRSKHSNLVDATIALYNSKEEFILALAPEGTRAHVENLKSGFFHIAKGAKIPVVCAALDFENKKIVVDEPVSIGGKTWEQAEPEFKSFFKQFKGKYPEKGIY